jgi:hypothetical protein
MKVRISLLKSIAYTALKSRLAAIFYLGTFIFAMLFTACALCCMLFTLHLDEGISSGIRNEQARPVRR